MPLILVQRRWQLRSVQPHRSLYTCPERRPTAFVARREPAHISSGSEFRYRNIQMVVHLHTPVLGGNQKLRAGLHNLGLVHPQNCLVAEVS